MALASQGNGVTKQLLHWRGGEYVRYIADQLRSTPPSRGNDYRDVVLSETFTPPLYRAMYILDRVRLICRFGVVDSGHRSHGTTHTSSATGHECWLTPHGELMNGSIINAYWTTVPIDLPIAARRNRSICTYLAEESVGDGLLLWTNVALRWWLQPLVDQWNYAQSPHDNHRTLCVCYHDLVKGPPMLEPTMQRILDHFFPGGHDFRAPKRLKKGAGGHATNKSRTELYLELERIDQGMFPGQSASLYPRFPCPSERHITGTVR